SITGGFVYRGCRMPDLRGRYFYSDYCAGFIRSFQGVSGGDAQDVQDHTSAPFPGGTFNVSSFGLDARGELCIADLGRGSRRAVSPSKASSNCRGQLSAARARERSSSHARAPAMPRATSPAWAAIL